MAIRYLIQVWVYPRSGFDLAKKNQAIRLLKELIEEDVAINPGLKEAMDRFEKEHEGMVVEPIVIESDDEVTNPETEVMPTIKGDYPEALLLSCEKLPEFLQHV